jgi:hypothetical protein
MNRAPSAPLAWSRACRALDVQGTASRTVRADRTRTSVRLQPMPDAERREPDLPAVMCLSVRESFLRRIAAPLADARRARKVLPTLLDIDLPFPIEDCVYDFLEEPAHRGGNLQALAVGARRSDLERKVRAGADAGCDPVVVDQEGLVLWTQAQRDVPAAAGETARAVIHLGSADASMAVGADGRLLGAYGLRSTDTAAHIGQILRSLLPAGTRVATVWAGAGAADAGRVAHLAEAVAGDWPGAPATVRDPALFLARGLAFRALCGGPLVCNLRAGQLTHPALLRLAVRRQCAAAVTVIVAGLALLMANGVWRGRLDHQARTLDLAFGSLASELAGFPVVARGDDAIRQVTTAVDALRRELAPMESAFAPTVAGHVAAVMACAAEYDLRLSQIALRSGTADISGDAGQWNAPERLVARLRALGYATHANRQDARDDGRIPFTIATEAVE